MLCVGRRYEDINVLEEDMKICVGRRYEDMLCVGRRYEDMFCVQINTKKTEVRRMNNMQQDPMQLHQESIKEV